MITPSQTVGPFFGHALPYEGGPEIVFGWRSGSVKVQGRMFDGAGVTVPDGLVEIWQADEDGRIPAARPGALRRDGQGFSGFGRCATDAAGAYWFRTVKPGATGTGNAPYLSVLVFARGLLKPVFTRMYFPEDTAAHESDPLLSQVPAERRDTLIAHEGSDGSYRFDIHLQGERETVFLAF